MKTTKYIIFPTFPWPRSWYTIEFCTSINVTDISRESKHSSSETKHSSSESKHSSSESEDSSSESNHSSSESEDSSSENDDSSEETTEKPGGKCIHYVECYQAYILFTQY